jgi:cysteinyl-tRNA synthetase
VLGLNPLSEQWVDAFKKDDLAPERIEEIEKLIEQRATAKKNKDFATADKIRDTLFADGIKLIDQQTGTTWEQV